MGNVIFTAGNGENDSPEEHEAEESVEARLRAGRKEDADILR